MRCVFVALCFAVFLQSASGQDQDFFDVTNHPLVVGSIYSDTDNLSSTPSTTGALGVNIDWENGLRSDFFIEQQRRGADWVAAGLAASNQSDLDTGYDIINWGMDRHAADGSFPGTGDAVHSTSLFLEGAARASVLLENASLTTETSVWIPKLQATANYMIDPNVVNPGASNNLEPFGHRYFLRAAGVEMAATLAGGDAALSAGAESLVQQGLANQQPDGVMPERGGFDFNYQGIGLAYLGRYYQFSDNATLKAEIAQSMSDQLSHFQDRVDSMGNVDLTDSTRISTEASRGGGAKALDTNNVLQGFLYAHEITGDAGFLDLANKIANPLRPIVEYGFDDTGSLDGQPSTGNDDSSQATLFTRTNSNTIELSPLGAAGSGVSGGTNDHAYDLSSTAGMASGNGPFARTAGDVDSLDGLSSFTMTGWFRTDGAQEIGGNVEILKTDTMKLTATDGGFLRLFVDSDSGSDSVVSTNPDWTAEDQWVFFAVSYDGTMTTDNVRFYTGQTDQALQLSSIQTLDRQAVDIGASRLFVSRQNRPFDGLMDNLRVYGSDTDASGVLTEENLEDLRQFDLLAVTAVPEPTSVIWLGFAMFVLMSRRSREPNRD